MDFRIVLFSSFENQSLPYLLKELYAQGLTNVSIILDGSINERDRKIQEERTRGFFKPADFFDIEQYEVPMFFVKNHNGDSCKRLLQKIKPDVIVNAGTPRILKENVLSSALRGVVNCHPGLLPAYRGCTCVEWAIYNDDKVGATCHFIDQGIDTGPVIYKEIMPVRRGDIYEKVRTDMIFHWIKVLVNGLEKVRAENLYFNSLPPQDNSEAKYYKVIPDDKLEEVKKILTEQRYGQYSA